ncbi:tho complex subunit 6 [Nicotiana attenuata]|uniref:Tho complex subunit 6 n=1 Tax=Nicotiana attenuata TaxID=49451 RepID=A0A1J6HZY1_NICAT|nr:tho complex subunit 6 [Nicotiana attenuata]
MAVNTQTGSIFAAAAGDSCAYCWDVEKNEIRMVLKGHSDYLHCIVARNSHNQVITGSEDGTARIWDCRTGVTAVAGYGALVDIVSQFGSHLCTFQC